MIVTIDFKNKMCLKKYYHDINTIHYFSDGEICLISDISTTLIKADKIEHMTIEEEVKNR